MTNETFEEFRARRERERAEADRSRVTWRKISSMTGGGWSGIGPAGPSRLAFVSESREATKEDLPGMKGWAFARVWDYGTIENGERVIAGCSMSSSRAKKLAAALITEAER